MKPLQLGALALIILTSTPALARKPGRYVKIESAPKGATVYLDSKDSTPLGVTPIKRVRIEYGFHEFIFVLSGHKTHKKGLNVGRRTYRVTVDLEQLAKVQVRAASPEINGAEVRLDGKVMGTIPTDIETEPGRHQISVTKPGFQTYQQWVDLRSAETMTIPIVLIPERAKKGVVFVTADISGVPVFIDGEEKGFTPLSLDLQPGPVVVELRAPDYPPWQKTVEIKAGQKTIVEARIRPDTGPRGTLLILSNVPGTSIYVDGVATGTAPVTARDLVAGTHLVEGKAEGFQANQTTAPVVAGKQSVVKLTLEELKIEYGRISVRASVPGAAVYVDGGERGPAPAELENIPLGPHSITVRLEGYQDFDASCELKRNQVCNVMAKLVPLSKVEVTANVVGATLFVDGKQIGPLPFTGTFTAGDHVFRVEAPDYQAREQPVNLQAQGELRRLVFDLKSSGTSEADLRERDKVQTALRARQFEGATGFTGVPLAPRKNVFDIGISLPHILEMRGNVGLVDYLAIAVSLRVLERDISFGVAELGIRAHTGIRPVRAFSVGAQLEVYGGTNFSTINNFGGEIRGLGTLHFGERGTFTLGVAAQFGRDTWSDIVDTNDPVVTGNGAQNFARLLIGGTVTYQATASTGIYFGLDKAVGNERLLLNQNYFRLFDVDTLLYLRAGFMFNF